MIKVVTPTWQRCLLCGTATTTPYCSVCIMQTPPPLFEAFEKEGKYTVMLSTGLLYDFIKAEPAGDFAHIVATSGEHAYIRISSIVFCKKGEA